MNSLSARALVVVQRKGTCELSTCFTSACVKAQFSGYGGPMSTIAAAGLKSRNSLPKSVFPRRIARTWTVFTS